MENIKGWTVFKWRGVAVRLHASLLILVIYILAVAPAQFDLVVRESGVPGGHVAGSPLLWGFIFALSLIVSVLIHEFGHVLVALRLGAKVRGITLLMLGGASDMEQVPERPIDEFKVSIAGPLVSLGIGTLLLILHGFTTSPELSLYGFWIGQMNIGLGLFNLLPAFPMDGGRVLRAALAHRQGRLRGTRTAVKISRVFSWTFGLWGLLSWNLILVFIAFFIYAAAQSELLVVTAHEILGDLRLRDVMKTLPSLPGTASLAEAAEVLFQSKHLTLPVISDKSPFGLFGLRQLRSVKRADWPMTKVDDVMLKIPNALSAGARIDDTVIATLATSPSGMPVVDEGRVIGLVSFADCVDMMPLQELRSGKNEARKKTPEFGVPAT